MQNRQQGSWYLDVIFRVVSVTCYVAFGGYSLLAAERATRLADEIQPLIDAHQGEVAVAIKYLPTGEEYTHRADVPMPTASLIKLPILVECFRQVHEGRLDWSQPIVLRQEDKVPGSGILTEHFREGAQLTLRDMAHLMIAFSDNTATNRVIDAIGLPSTSTTMQRWGYANTRLHSYVFRRDTSVDPLRSEQFGLGSTTAAETMRLLEHIATGTLLTDEVSRQVLEHLTACQDRSMLAKRLPAGVRIAHKSGAVAQSRCDAGVIDLPQGRLIVVVLTSKNEDRSWTDENHAQQLCADIGWTAWQYFDMSHGSTGGPLVLSEGASGDMVVSLQRTLNARSQPTPNLQLDGDFGPATAAAVRAWQHAHGLTVDGRVEQTTWQSLGPLLEDPEAAAPEVVNAATLPRKPFDELQAPPAVTCSAWAIADARTGQLLWHEQADVPHHPASITKVMTAVVTLEMAQRDPALLNEIVTISQRADATDGSTATVRAGERLPLGELLYGLMLPSGNDASVAIAEHLGGRCAEDASRPSTDPLDRFVAHMNRTAKLLGLSATTFRNPHGLTHAEHQTTARDLARLAAHAMSLDRFRELVRTRQHGCRLQSESGYVRDVVWKNTNALLETQGFYGIKTGTTDAAGACLMSVGERSNRSLCVVVLHATSSDARYIDSRNLYRWAWQQLGREVANASTTETTSNADPRRFSTVVVSPAAESLHRESLVVDGHNDLPWQFRERGLPSFQQLDVRRWQPSMHTDIPRLRQGNVGAQFWSVYVPAEYGATGKALLTTLEQIDFVHALVKEYPDTFALALTSDDIERCRREGKIASLIGVEGGHSIENSLGVLRQLQQRGARYMTLTHSLTLDWADSATDVARHQGLTSFGEDVVREMNRLGMLVDLSHVSIETMHDALDITQAPVIFSHSSARHVADHPRNVPDDVLKRLPQNGGVVMVNFFPGFVVPASARLMTERMHLQQQLRAEGRAAESIDQELKRWDLLHPLDRGSIYDVVDHIDHIVRVAGIDHVGLGSDYDGIGSVPVQLEDVSTYPRITQMLLDRGYEPAAIKKILGENLVRVLRAAEHVAASK